MLRPPSIPLVSALSRRLQAVEDSLTQPRHAIGFLVARAVLMLAMVLAFWWANRAPH